MEHTIENGVLRVRIDSLGAQLMSIQKEGTEYLWQGNPQYWARRAPLLFPFVGRLPEDRYIYKGKSYPMTIHGFLSHRAFSVMDREENSIRYVYEPTEETQKIYPFLFRFFMRYSIWKNMLYVDIKIENTGKKHMHFAFGGHPGFCVPLEKHLDFEDYFLQFPQASLMQRVVFDHEHFFTEKRNLLVLENGRLNLRHNLFDDDAIVLECSGGKVELHTDKGERGISIEYPGTPYLGLWHRPHTDAPYVCIEPWSALPGRAGEIVEPEQRPDFCHLGAGEVYRNRWSLSFW